MPIYNQVEQCPVLGCGAIIKSRHGMRCHFMYRHYYDTIIITEEGPLPRCELCGMFCTQLSLTGLHQESQICRKGAQQNKQKMKNLQCIRAFRRTLTVQDQIIENVTSFRYLGHTITSRDTDWMAAHQNLQKAQQRWMHISRVLSREGASPRISAMFYKATIQMVLLFGLETWVVNNDILQLLTSFHHSVARRLTG
jgi:hypothetical protein